MIVRVSIPRARSASAWSSACSTTAPQNDQENGTTIPTFTGESYDGGGGRPPGPGAPCRLRPSPAPPRAPRAPSATPPRSESARDGRHTRRGCDSDDRACDSPPFRPVAVDECVELVAGRLECLDPALEEHPAGVGERVRALGRAGQVGAPLRVDDAVLFERPHDPVEIPDVDALLTDQLRQPVEQLVAVPGAFAQHEQDRRLDEPLDARADRPLARRD